MQDPSHSLKPALRRAASRSRLWRRTPRHAPSIPASLLEPLASAHVEFAIEFSRGLLAMNKVAEAATDTALAAVEPTASFAEVGDGREFAVDGATSVPTRVERIASFLRIFFVLEPDVDVTDEMVIVIIAHNQLLNQPILTQLAPNVLVKGIKVHLHLLRIHLVLGVVRRVLVQVRQQDRLRVRRLDVFSRAAVAMTARANLVVEGTVYFVLFGAEDGGEVVGHGCRVSRVTGDLRKAMGEGETDEVGRQWG